MTVPFLKRTIVCHKIITQEKINEGKQGQLCKYSMSQLVLSWGLETNCRILPAFNLTSYFKFPIKTILTNSLINFIESSTDQGVSLSQGEDQSEAELPGYDRKVLGFASMLVHYYF